MAGVIHPRVRALVMCLPLVVLGLLMWWSRAPTGKTGQVVGPVRQIVVVFHRRDRPPGTVNLDARAGEIEVSADGRARRMRWSCPGFSGGVSAISVQRDYESLAIECGGKEPRQVLDPVRMTLERPPARTAVP